jgi:hypothetical protein
MSLKKIFLFVALLAIVSSCGFYQSPTEKLKESVRYFNEGVRWGRLQDVMARVDPMTEEHFLEMHKDFGKLIKVEHYEVASFNVDLEKKLAQVGIKLVWYRVDEMLVHETVLLQRWEERKGKWLMVAEEYHAGSPF